MVRMSVPDSSRWTAKACRSEWGVTCLESWASSRADLHADSHGASGYRLAGMSAWEEPFLWPHGPPVGAQGVQQLGRQHYVAVPLSFALLHADDHSSAINRGGFETDCLRDAQTSGVADGQDRSMFDAGYARRAAAELPQG